MDVYDLHSRAFARAEAYVILDRLTAGDPYQRFATVALHHPADGASRTWAYVHVFGMEMVRSYAAGYGYDKSSAAVGSAARKKLRPLTRVAGWDRTLSSRPDRIEAFIATLSHDNGHDWTRNLIDADFEPLRAV